MASRSDARGTTEFDRGLTFFDAIFAVAITLLIVSIEPPTAEHWASWDALAGSGVLDQLLAFTISFFVIANFWKVNHRLMGQVSALDGTLLNANIVAMFFVVVLPFTTAAMSESSLDTQPLPVVDPGRLPLRPRPGALHLAAPSAHGPRHCGHPDADGRARP